MLQLLVLIRLFFVPLLTHQYSLKQVAQFKGLNVKGKIQMLTLVTIVTCNLMLFAQTGKGDAKKTMKPMLWVVVI